MHIGCMSCMSYVGKKKNTEKNKAFSIPIEKQVTEIDKDGNESVVTISYKIKFIDSEDFWQLHYQALLIISQKIHKIKCKDCDCFLE